MKIFSTAAVFVITLLLIFFPNATFSQELVKSNLYQSMAQHGVNFGKVSEDAPFQVQLQKQFVAKTEPEVRVSLQPITRQNIVSDYVVINTNDYGDGSFRRAITDANSNPGLDRIIFNIPGVNVHTITPVSQLPSITDSVIIDGATQFGYNGTPLIEIDGSSCNAGSNGLVITAGKSIVRGLIINSFIANGNSGGMGIVLDSKGSNIIEGNYIGTDATGNSAKGNGGSGIAIFGASSGNLIGGITAAARNVISGNNLSGIQISTGSAGGNKIKGNYIGITATTWDSLGNHGNGIFIDAIGDTVGGDYSTAKNIIADNHYPGIFLGSNAANTVIEGNSIGWLSGDVTWGNHDNGIAIIGAQNIQIGGIMEGKRNLIAANAYPGIAIVGNSATGNIVEGNWIGGSLKIGPTNWSFVAGNSIGVYIENASGNVIGGRLVGSGNIISLNNSDGIVIRGNGASGNRIVGNTIGSSGTQSIVGAGNYNNGVFIDNAPSNSIGGNEPLSANNISGNGWNGIFIKGDGATGNVVRGNVIGISKTDSKPLWGNWRDGILIAASMDTIGGEGLNDENIIAYNKGCGVFDSTGNQNLFIHNSIYLNSGLGIDLAPRGFTPNDILDADMGANDGQNFPILDSAVIDYPNTIQIYGIMNSSPNAALHLDFYKSDTCNVTKFGDGQTWLGSGTVFCDENGCVKFGILINAAVTYRDYITATATNNIGSTSGFSRGLRMLDTDGDGILDIWEEKGGGIDWNCDGFIDLSLWDKNANPFHKDIFVEVDRMEGFLTYPGALSDVEVAFHGVPNKYINNPDGADGINLHAEFDPSETPIQSEILLYDPWLRFYQIKAENFGTSLERNITNPNKENILNAKKLVYRYCLFANQYGTKGSSGLARKIYSADFIVTLGHPGFNDYETGGTPGGTRYHQSGTFMHELGHTLGLKHGGSDGIHYKTNYYSIMNYLWQFPRDIHRPNSWQLNYSPVALSTLDEMHLDELHGLNPQPGDYPIVSIPYNRPDNSYGYAILAPATSVNWDGDNDSSGFAKKTVDINYFEDPISPGQSLTGFADWPNLKYSVRNLPISSLGKFSKAAEDSSQDEIDAERYQIIQNIPAYGIIKPLSHWSEVASNYSRISTGYFSDFDEQMISDGKGGGIISWFHIWSENSGSYPADLRAQRIDSLGRIMWDNNGIPISHGEIGAQLHSIVSDGSDGAIITWEDQRLGSDKNNIYSQHIDGYGHEQWTPHGVPITSYTTVQPLALYPKSVSDYNGGAIISWTNNYSVYIQRIDSMGKKLWPTDGLFLFPLENPNDYSIVSDGSGGAIVLWKNTSLGGPYYFPWFAQHIDQTGARLWGTNGNQVTPLTTISCDAIEDINGGAIIVLTNSVTNPVMRVCLQRIGFDGSLRWPLEGIQLDTAVNWASKFSPQIVQDDKGVITIGWLMKYNGVPTYDLFIQRADSSGIIKWQNGGIHVIGSLNPSYSDYSLVGTKNNRAIVIFPSSRNEYGAQCFDSTGSIAWSEGGVPVSQGPYIDNAGIHGVTDNGNGAVVVFRSRNLAPIGNTEYWYSHIYAQRLSETGGLGGGVVTSIQDEHSSLPNDFELMQNFPNPFNPTTKIRFTLPEAGLVKIEIYDILGQRVARLLNNELSSGIHEVNFDGSRLASGMYIYTIEVKDKFFKAKKMMLLK